MLQRFESPPGPESAISGSPGDAFAIGVMGFDHAPTATTARVGPTISVAASRRNVISRSRSFNVIDSGLDALTLARTHRR